MEGRKKKERNREKDEGGQKSAEIPMVIAWTKILLLWDCDEGRQVEGRWTKERKLVGRTKTKHDWI